MNDNWYSAYVRFKQHEAELLLRLERSKPWLKEEHTNRGWGLITARVRDALVRKLLSWVNALSASASESCKDC